MPRAEKVIFAILVVSAAMLWIMLGWDFYMDTWLAPLGPEISLPAPAASPFHDPVALTQVAESAELVFPPATKIPEGPRYTESLKSPLCGGPHSMIILAIGSDTRSQNYLYGLADVIRYIKVDFVEPQITVLEFPRDLWVEIPEIEDHYGITHGKLNQAYFYGNPGMGYYQGPGQGPGLLARTMELNFDARPDHYIAANMQTFVRFINALEGITVELPYSVDARKPEQQDRKDLYFESGRHHLNGEQTLMLARIREISVFGRADQQNRILCAIREKITNPAILQKLPQLIESFAGAIQTDLSPHQLSQLACLAPKIKAGDIIFTTFPRNLLTESRTFDIGVKKDVYIFTADFNTLKLFVQAFDLGAWPELDSEKSTPEASKPRGESRFNCP